MLATALLGPRPHAPRILAFVLAGGEGQRLRPLTRDRAKPAVELAHGYRIVDFVLGNLANSAVPWICVVAQYKPEALIDHIRCAWQPWLAERGCTLHMLLPPPDAPFAGTASAIHANLGLLDEFEPDVVAVFAADHVYRMDIRHMADAHLRRRADVSVAVVPVPLEQASSFGVVRAGGDGRIERFDEKPLHPRPIPGDPRHALASMGNYLFDPLALADLVQASLSEGGKDFGRDVLPQAVEHGARVFAYDFSRNVVPGVKSHEEAAYWRDVGTLEALEAARRDFDGPAPRFDLRNTRWPLKPRAEDTEKEVHGEVPALLRPDTDFLHRTDRQ